jgi:hypothetical protein
MTIKLKTTKKESALIVLIASRFIVRHLVTDHLDLIMDITACHLNGCPLDLERLLTAPDFDFDHDVAGIHGYLDRKTGKLLDNFLPRYAL